MSDSALILEGGGLRGVFTCGVTDCFLDNSISFTDIWAVSAGSCVTCSFLAGQRRRAFRVMTGFLGDPRYCSVRSFLTTGDLFGVKFNYDTVSNVLDPVDYEAFRKNPTEFFAVVTNCGTGEAEYKRVFDLRPHLIWVRASSSLPLLSRMVKVNGQNYLDGGISDSIPLKAAREYRKEKGRADRAVVVLTREDGYFKKPEATAPAAIRYAKYPHLREAMKNRHTMYNSELAYLRSAESSGAAFIIRPPEPLGLSRTEKDKAKLEAGYELGYNTAKELLPRLLEFLS